MVLRVDCLDAEGAVWVITWEWISEFRGWYRKAVITTTLVAFGIEGGGEGTVLRRGSIKTNGLGRDDTDGSQAGLEEGFEASGVSNEADWIVVEKGCDGRIYVAEKTERRREEMQRPLATLLVDDVWTSCNS